MNCREVLFWRNVQILFREGKIMLLNRSDLAEYILRGIHVFMCTFDGLLRHRIVLWIRKYEFS